MRLDIDNKGECCDYGLLRVRRRVFAVSGAIRLQSSHSLPR